VVANDENAKVSSDYGLYIISPRLRIMGFSGIEFFTPLLTIEGTNIA